MGTAAFAAPLWDRQSISSHDQIVGRMARMLVGAGMVSWALLRQRKVSRLYLCNRRRRFLGRRSVSVARICHVDGSRVVGTSNLVLEVE